MSREFIAVLQARRAERKSELDAVLTAPTAEKRDLHAEERDTFERLEGEVRELDARIAELDEQLVRDDQAAEVAKRYIPRAEVTREPRTYERGNGQSYFQDFAKAQILSDSQARSRLQQHAREMDVELPKRDARRRAKAEEEMRGLPVGSTFERRTNPNRTDGQGGYFVPPEWLIDQYIDLPRYGRVLANSVRNLTLPGGTDSINVPKIATGTATGVQSADAAAVTSQDLTDTYVSAPVRTIAGQQDVAIQLLDQSPGSFDEIIFADLMADYNQRLDTQCWSGSGASGQLLGVLNVSGSNSVSYTDASPTLPKLYTPLMQGISQSARSRKMPPTAVFMAPARWYWGASQLDANGRPLLVPETNAPFNPLALQTGGDVEGPVGRVLNLPILADGNIPSNLGAGTNQDAVVAMRTSDLFLWEGNMRTRALQEVLSGTLQVRFQLFNYCAFMPNRRPETISVVGGTGLVAPAGF
ncbi:phage major capsid protein [Kitasatospora sp. NBC_01266]|uniref:phage major capsid protein n=1 Tax=Kitasatospora sp. NBC_01266 TaxID=2903572 RepID=UPI002E30D31A|nr:phage major capsid protein [Kitasatospora sp. NBC_01266]